MGTITKSKDGEGIGNKNILNTRIFNINKPKEGVEKGRQMTKNFYGIYFNLNSKTMSL